MTPAEQRADDFPVVVAALLGARRVTAICHENPDADTIGAAIAVAIICAQLGKETEIVSVDPPAPAFEFLPRFDQIIRSPRLDPDVAVVCDAASLARVGSIVSDAAEWLSRATLVTSITMSRTTGSATSTMSTPMQLRPARSSPSF